MTPAEEKELARLGAARQRAVKAYDAAHDELRVFVVERLSGATEHGIARVGQIDRMAVRRWRGKQQ